ncbi:unnamed protein product [Notodromas monacha]|uniref:Ubiquitin fusion degradation protein 1 homolog n=1 Tax=Notodromas monacha TaxID=399045 RepID=A0A7R9BYN7_9CRUS|nr:unnamed protein product [Notodromas monacha]CAG0924168.1 unnamed protein product [Notodromas monacha]
MFHGPWQARPFNNRYKCYSISMFPGKERGHIEKGGKIIMPQSALDQLTQLNMPYPLLFKLTNETANRVTHCGVLEFVAEEGKLYVPYWMMRNLLLQEGEMVRVQTVNLPSATFTKFKPLSVTFLEITNPKAVLENALRTYACLTAGDVIAIHYNDTVYEISVLETKPAQAVSIIECDMDVDFAPPEGYKEEFQKRSSAPSTTSQTPAIVRITPEAADDKRLSFALLLRNFQAFAGKGRRLNDRNGQSLTPEGNSTEVAEIEKVGIPDFDFKIGRLTFMPGVRLDYTEEGDRQDVETGFNAFSGTGHTLRQGGKSEAGKKKQK